MGIEPAARQRLPGRKDQIRFEKELRLLQLFTGMQTALQVRGEGIKQRRQGQDLHQGAVLPGFQKHRASGLAASGLFRHCRIGRRRFTASTVQALHLQGDERSHRAPEQVGNQQQRRRL